MLSLSKKRRIPSAVYMLNRKPVMAYMLPMKRQDPDGLYELELPTCSRNRRIATTSSSVMRNKTIVEVDPRTGGPSPSLQDTESSTGGGDYRQKYRQPVLVLKESRAKMYLLYNLNKSIQTGRSSKMVQTSNIPHTQDKSTSMPSQGVYGNTMMDEATSVEGLTLKKTASTSTTDLAVDFGTSYDESDSEDTAERAMDNLCYALSVYDVSLDTFIRGLELVRKEEAELMAEEQSTDDKLMIGKETANSASTESFVSLPPDDIYYDAEEGEETPAKSYCDVGTETTPAKSYCGELTKTIPAKSYCDVGTESYCYELTKATPAKSYCDVGTETTPAKSYCDEVTNAIPVKSYCDASTERDQGHCQNQTKDQELSMAQKAGMKLNTQI